MAHLLAKPNYGDNICPLVSEIIILKPFFSFPSPRLFGFQNPYTRASSTSMGCNCFACNSLETVMVPIHLPLRLYKPAPGNFFSLILFLQPLATAPITTFLLPQWPLLPLLPPPFPLSPSPLVKPLQNMTPLLPTRPALLCIRMYRSGTSNLGQWMMNP
jgi:hypothetical protein